MGDMVEVKAQLPVPAYVARPDGAPKGAVIVIHEVWGLADHIKSVADRLAVEGYLALAPDLLSGTGVDVGSIINLQEALFDPARRNEVQPVLRKALAPMQEPEFGTKTLERLKACFDYVYQLPEVNQKVAVMGFCFGGTYSYSLAVAEPNLKLALPFYGHSNQSVDELKQITCPIRAFFGANDENLISGLPDLTDRMKEAGVDFVSKVYPNSGHAFFNDTNRNAYNAEAAADSWKLSLEYLAKYVG
jgi:carboxymethylenebutenolidase